jgi:hypothetical protein
MLTAAKAFIVFTTDRRSSVLWILLFRPSIVCILVFFLLRTRDTSSNAQNGIQVLIPEFFAALDSVAHLIKLFSHALPHLRLGLGHILQFKIIKNTPVNGNKDCNLFGNPERFIPWLF